MGLAFVGASAGPAYAEDAPASPAQTTPAQAPAAESPKHTRAETDEETSHPSPNSVFAEGLGAGILYSINYERLVLDDVGVRIGFSYTSLGASATAANGQTASASATWITIPITASYIGVRSGKHSLELGGGATLSYMSAGASGVGAAATSSGVQPLGIAMVGYRLHPVDHAGFQFRVGAMALAGQGLALSNPNGNSFGVLPWLYLSLGASF
ncbi:MAG: hypothetical protein JOZ69_01020 [Myxococcales bacterium]|nr:hypothetical protein [Myxococcales bacterium]